MATLIVFHGDKPTIGCPPEPFERVLHTQCSLTNGDCLMSCCGVNNKNKRGELWEVVTRFGILLLVEDWLKLVLG